jgi:hypothetical protein
MAFLYAPGEDPSRVYYGTDTRAFSLLLGAALAFVWPSQRLSKTLPRHASWVLEIVGITGLLLLMIMFILTSEFDTFHYQGGMLLLSVITIFVTAALAHPASMLAKWLSVKPLRWIGVRSYGIYLWHYPIISLTTPIINTDGINFWRITLQIAVTMIVSAFSYHFVETPIRKGQIKFTLTTFKKLTLIKRRIVIGSSAILFALLIGIGVEFAKTPVIVTTKAPLTIETIHEIEFNNDPIIEPEPAPEMKTITVIGDSILHDIAPFFKIHFPEAVIDYRVGRQMSEVPEVVKQLESSGQLGENVIIQLGTNGPFVKTDLLNLIKSLELKKVYLVNCRVPRVWESTVNRTLEEVVNSMPNTVLVDWYSASTGHPEFFANDGVHLKRAGGETYANLIASKVAE